ncbi:MAG: hypothetical protein QG650_959 [Patescibacteria group bacterium]|nr:hypothetical protein [Patescibacteria group bacterium]
MNVEGVPFHDSFVYGLIAGTIIAMGAATWYLAEKGKI